MADTKILVWDSTTASARTVKSGDAMIDGQGKHILGTSDRPDMEQITWEANVDTLNNGDGIAAGTYYVGGGTLVAAAADAQPWRAPVAGQLLNLIISSTDAIPADCSLAVKLVEVASPGGAAGAQTLPACTIPAAAKTASDPANALAVVALKWYMPVLTYTGATSLPGRITVQADYQRAAT